MDQYSLIDVQIMDSNLRQGEGSRYSEPIFKISHKTYVGLDIL